MTKRQLPAATPLVCQNSVGGNKGLMGQVKSPELEQNLSRSSTVCSQTARGACRHCWSCKSLSRNDNDETEVGRAFLLSELSAAAGGASPHLIFKINVPLYSIFGSLGGGGQCDAGEQRVALKRHLPHCSSVITSSGFVF